jgi:hypothetical protein
MIDSELSAVERRVAILEAEVAAMRSSGAREPSGQGSAAGILQEARAKQASIAITATEVLATMGIAPKGSSPEQVQRMMVDEGIRPDDNAFSREIKSMREE